MKNFFLLGLLWLISFIIEISFSWDMGNINLRPYTSYFILGYVCFALPTLNGLLFSSIVFVILSSFSITGYFPIFSVLSIYLITLWIKKKTYVDNFLTKAALIFLTILFNSYLTKVFYGVSFSIGAFTFLTTLCYLAYLSMNVMLGGLCFWALEVKGALWEEKILSFRFTSEASLLESKTMKKNRSYRFQFTRSPRRRLVLKDSW